MVFYCASNDKKDSPQPELDSKTGELDSLAEPPSADVVNNVNHSLNAPQKMNNSPVNVTGTNALSEKGNSKNAPPSNNLGGAEDPLNSPPPETPDQGILNNSVPQNDLDAPLNAGLNTPLNNGFQNNTAFNNSQQGAKTPPIDTPAPLLQQNQAMVAAPPPIEGLTQPTEIAPQDALETKEEQGQQHEVTPKVTKEEELEIARKVSLKLKDLAPGDGPEVYVVQHGDTLWDISDQFAGDPYWWSKLWSYNPAIKNPNLIHPGDQIVFYPADSHGGAPHLAIDDDAQPVKVGGMAVLDKTFQEELTEEQIERINGQMIQLAEIPSDPIIESVGNLVIGSSLLVQIPGFFSEKQPEPHGEIIVHNINSTVALPLQTIVAQFDQQHIPQAGSKYLCIRKADVSGGPAGLIPAPDLYLYTGVVNVTEVDPKGMASLWVEQSQQGIMAGDLIVPYQSIERSVDLAGGSRDALFKGTVIAALGTTATLSQGVGSTIFLKKEGNVSPGDDFGLYMPQGGVLGFGETTNLKGTRVGKARVVDVQAEGLLAVVTETKAEISAGAQTWPEFQ